MSSKTNVLIVDDRPENLLSLEAMLEDSEINIFSALSGNEALSMLLKHDFALVFLDVQMPEMNGFEVAELMRARMQTRTIPIIFVTAINKDQEHIFKGYESGAVDYICKPILEPRVLQSKMKIFCQLHEQKSLIEKQVEELNSKNTLLEKQLAEIKTLRSILPICTMCKKVRDDQGYWKQLESYLYHHSGINFSHGYCPECGKKALAEIRKELRSHDHETALETATDNPLSNKGKNTDQ